MWFDPTSGRRRTVWAFVMVLACSRYLFVRPTLVMDQAERGPPRTWRPSPYFGGVPPGWSRTTSRPAWTSRDLYDPKINRSYAELAAHYDTLVDRPRAFKPKDKAAGGAADAVCARLVLARSGVQPALTDMRAAALVWSREVAGRRACRPLDGAAPAAVFAAVEAQTLRSLPAAPFVLATWSSARVGPGHSRQGRRHASTRCPGGFLGDRVDARSTPSMVQFFAPRRS